MSETAKKPDPEYAGDMLVVALQNTIYRESTGHGSNADRAKVRSDVKEWLAAFIDERIAHAKRVEQEQIMQNVIAIAKASESANAVEDAIGVYVVPVEETK